MGDPECQTILPILKSDFVEVLENCINGTLDKIQLSWKNKKSICIVLTSKGYPENYKKNIIINNLEKINNNNNQYIFHAGTKSINEQIFSNGGRVLNFVSIDDDFKTARERVIDLIGVINWENGYFRKDIGYKVIEK